MMVLELDHLLYQLCINYAGYILSNLTMTLQVRVSSLPVYIFGNWLTQRLNHSPSLFQSRSVFFFFDYKAFFHKGFGGFSERYFNTSIWKVFLSGRVAINFRSFPSTKEVGVGQ